MSQSDFDAIAREAGFDLLTSVPNSVPSAQHPSSLKRFSTAISSSAAPHTGSSTVTMGSNVLTAPPPYDDDDESDEDVNAHTQASKRPRHGNPLSSSSSSSSSSTAAATGVLMNTPSGLMGSSSSAVLPALPSFGPLSAGADNKAYKGLRHFSYKVCEKVRAAGSTKHDDIADQLVREATEEGLEGFDEKNIRRRVYDALNVLMALQIIHKDRKLISWKGLPAQYHAEFSQLRASKNDLEAKIMDKKRQLEALRATRSAMERLYRRNEESPRVASLPAEAKISLPFIVLSTRRETQIDCEMAEDRSEIFFNFSQSFQIHDDGEILRMLGYFGANQGPNGAAANGNGNPGAHHHHMLPPSVSASSSDQ
eukprot:ANDGO_04280.mRNA.1 Transcription factor Dp